MAYEKGHKCMFKEPQLFSIEVPEDNDDMVCEVEENEQENEVFPQRDSKREITTYFGQFR